MIWQWPLLLGTFLVGGLSSYTTTVASRAPYGAERIAEQAAWRSVLGGLNILAFFAALIWGFIHLTWYLVMLGAIGILLINGFIYGGQHGFVFWYRIQPLLAVLCIAGAISLWLLF